jgi:hypothetical protein
MTAPTEAGSFGGLDPAIQKLESNVTVPRAEAPNIRSSCGGCTDHLVRRKAYFYDTHELALVAKHLILRARVTDGDDGSGSSRRRVPYRPRLGRPQGELAGVSWGSYERRRRMGPAASGC